MAAPRSNRASAQKPQQDVGTRIVRSAERLFRRVGYVKTSVAEIARDAGISTAYVYRFFSSKMLICQAVCTVLMERITDVIWEVARSTLEPEVKVRRVYVRLMEEAVRQQADEERLTEMVQASMAENWDSVDRFRETLLDVSRAVIGEGVGAGAFVVADQERAARGMAATLLLCSHPVLVQEAMIDGWRERAETLADLVVDGLCARPAA